MVKIVGSTPTVTTFMLCPEVVKRRFAQRLIRIRKDCWWCRKAFIKFDKVVHYPRTKTYRGFFECPKCKMLGMTYKGYTALKIMRGIRQIEVL